VSEPLKCAECHVELTVADAEEAVPTDAGPVHRECFEGPVPPPPKASDFLDEFEPLAEETLTPEEIEAENERRSEMGDPPLPENDCFECHAEPSIGGGRGFLCRGRSMLQWP
jgi:hypothetical protein